MEVINTRNQVYDINYSRLVPFNLKFYLET